MDKMRDRGTDQIIELSAIMSRCGVSVKELASACNMSVQDLIGRAYINGETFSDEHIQIIATVLGLTESQAGAIFGSKGTSPES